MNTERSHTSDSSILTPQEVADALKITRNTVYELIRRGDLQAFRAGKKVRVEQSEIDAYKRRTGSRKGADVVSLPAESLKSDVTTPNSQAAAFHRSNSPEQVVLCGQDLILDILARHLQMHPLGAVVLRSFSGSYNGLVSLYRNEVHATTVHLWDGETNTYNTPYIRHLVPGTPCLLIHLARRLQGLFVQTGNPKGIYSWRDLNRSDVTLINREKGCGTRVLLDEQMRLCGINTSTINGYQRESTSHLAVASIVSRGGADVGIGNEKTAQQVRGIDFVPLQEERLELVMRKSDLSDRMVATIIEILRSDEFRYELEGIGGYNLEELGQIINDLT